MYGIEDHPIYLKDFMQLLRETDLSSPILDACIYALSENYPNSSVFVASSVQGKQILISPRDDTLKLGDLNPSEHESILVPLRLDKEWMLSNVKPRIKEISVWHPTRDLVQSSHAGKGILNIFHSSGNKEWHFGPEFKLPQQAETEQSSGLKILRTVSLYLFNSTSSEQDNSRTCYQFRQQLAKLCLAKGRLQYVSANPLTCLLGDLHPNGLLKDPKYYFRARSRAHIVAKYGTGLDALESNAFTLLADNDAELVTPIINAAIYIGSKTSHTRFINVRVPTANEILFQRFKNTCLLSQMSYSFEGPYCYYAVQQERHSLENNYCGFQKFIFYGY